MTFFSRSLHFAVLATLKSGIAYIFHIGTCTRSEDGLFPDQHPSPADGLILYPQIGRASSLRPSSVNLTQIWSEIQILCQSIYKIRRLSKFQIGTHPWQTV